MKKRAETTIVEGQQIQGGLVVRMFPNVDLLKSTIESLAKRVFISPGIQSVLAGRNVAPELVREARCQFHSPMKVKDIGTVLTNRNSRWTVCIAMRVLTTYQSKPGTGLFLPYFYGLRWCYIEAIFFDSGLWVMFSSEMPGQTLPYRFQSNPERFDVALPVD